MTSLRLDDEQAELAAVAESVLAAHPDDPTAGADLGWFGVSVSEEHGGYGSFADLAVIAEAAGAATAATAAPWTAGVVAPLLGDDPLVAELIGGLPVAIAIDEAAGGAVLALGGGPGVPVAVARGGRLDVHTDVAVEAVDAYDPSRPVARYRLAAAPAVSVHVDRDAWCARVGLIAALDAAGCARVALARTVAYAKERRQFDRPIGSFQAYKHRCADMYVELQMAQSLAWRAAGALAGGDPSLALAAAVSAPASAVQVCGEAVQLHGGIGFTWEAGLHVLLKRARADQIVAACGGDTVTALLASHR